MAWNAALFSFGIIMVVTAASAPLQRRFRILATLHSYRGMVSGGCFVESRSLAVLGPWAAGGVDSLLLDGAQALYADGDLSAGRRIFDDAYRAAELDGDRAAMAAAALGLSGLWPHEQRSVPAAALVRTRLHHCLSTVDPRSALGLRLRARLAAESDYPSGGHGTILGLLNEAGNSADPIAYAEVAGLAHHCVLGPDHGVLRQTLTQQLIDAAVRTGRRCDLLMGVLRRTIDLFLDGDPRAERSLAELRGLLSMREHLAIGFVPRAMEVMLDIRAGRFARAETAAVTCAGRGRAAGDVDANGWYLLQMVALRWYQGRIGELIPALREIAGSPTLSMVDHSHRAALAMAAATAGDHREAAGALARLCGRDLTWLPRSSTWLASMHGIVECAHLLGDAQTAAVAYDLLTPFARLPMLASLGVACFGSVEHALGVSSLTTGHADRAVGHLRAAVRDNLALGHWPAVALSRWRLGQALALRGRTSDSAEAGSERDLAADEAAKLGMALPDGPAPPPGGGRPGQQRYPVTCRRLGRRWEITMGLRSARVEHSRGMLYLAMLCANPGHEIGAAELAAGPALLNPTAAENAARSTQPVLDDVARREYRQRLSTLQKQIEEYAVQGDADRAATAKAERDWLLAELTAATSLGGRARQFSSAEERARISVGKAIRRTLAHIESADPVIGKELRACIHTGRRCCYWPA